MSDENLSVFSEIDENDIVVRVIVVEQEYIDTGVLGDPANWIEGHSGIGDTYDKVNKVFIAEQPFPDWILDAEFQWQPPIVKPDDGEEYYWNVEKENWIKCPEPD